MSVILVSSDSPDNARTIADGVAERLGYRTLGSEVLAAAASAHSVDQGRLVSSLDTSRRLLGLSEGLRRRYLAYVQEAVLTDLVQDDVVCHGVGAHLYVFDVSHVLKARILPDVEQQTREVVDRERVSVEKARKVLERRAVQRRRWSKAAFGLDASDPSLYDLVIKLSQIEVGRAVDIIADTVRDPAFRTMTYSHKRLADLLLESRVRSVMIEPFPGVRVQARDGGVVVQVTALRRQRERATSSIRDLAAGIPGVESLEVEIVDDDLAEAAESLR